MRVIGIDSEWDTKDRRRLACVTFCALGPDGRPLPAEIMHGRDPALADRLLSLFRDPDVITVFAWGCADAITFAGALGAKGLAVLQAMADATRAGRLSDVCVRDLVLWCAVPDWAEWWQLGTTTKYRPPGDDDTGKSRPAVNLAALALRWLGRVVSKDDRIRLTFGELVDQPLETWPKEHVDYALDDASLPLEIWLAQRTCQPIPGDRPLPGGAGRKGWPIDPRRFAAHMRRWPTMRPHLYPAGVAFADRGLVPSESERIGVMFPLEWAREHGGLQVDGEYLERLITCYETAAELCRGPMAAAGIIVDVTGDEPDPEPVSEDEAAEGRPEGDATDAETRDSLTVVKRKRVWKGSRVGQSKAAWGIYDAIAQVLPDWAPELTKKGGKEHGYLGRTPWRKWREEDKRWASCGGRVVGEAALRLALAAADTPHAESPAVVKSLTKPVDTCLEAYGSDEGKHTSLIAALETARWPWAVALAVYNKATKYANDFLGPLRDFARYNMPVCPGFQPMLITGRLSLEGAIRQNEPRKGGIRECILPPMGHLIALADYSQIELVCLGHLLTLAYRQLHPDQPDYVSSLARVLNAGKDAHIILAIDLLAEQKPDTHAWLMGQVATAGADLVRLVGADARKVATEAAGEWAAHDLAKRWRKAAEALTDKHGKAARKLHPDLPWAHIDNLLEARQEAKNCNYGFGGLMQAEKFVLQQRRQGALTWTIGKAERARALWIRRWHEFPLYERLVKKLCQAGGYVRHPRVPRLRGGLNPTQCANTLFQTECAEMFCWAFSGVWYECLFGHAPGTSPPPAADLARARVILSGRMRAYAWYRPEAWPATVSPLYGSTPVLAIHDEIVIVVPAPDRRDDGLEVHSAHTQRALDRMRAIMLQAGALYLPGMLVETSGAYLARWRKV